MFAPPRMIGGELLWWISNMNISEYEIDGRILMLIQQREEAMNKIVHLAGLLNKLQKEFNVLKEQTDGNVKNDT